MAKKNTYAAMMKQLTNKKAQYEKGLEEARRTNNRSGVADYERRLTRLNAGMDELFQAQEMSKAPQAGAQFAAGGMTKNQAMYKLGGTYSDKMPPMVSFEGGGLTPGESNKLLPGSLDMPQDTRTPGMWGSGYSLLPWDGRPNALVDDNGNMILANYADGHFVMTPQLWKLRTDNPAMFNKAMENPTTGVGQFKFKPEEYQLGTFLENGLFVPNDNNADATAEVTTEATPAAEKAPASVGGLNDLEFLQAMDETMRNETVDVGNGIMFGSSVGPAATSTTPVGASAVGPTAAAPSTTGTTASAPTMSAADARASVMDKFGDRLAGGAPGAWRNSPLNEGSSTVVDKTDYGTDPTADMTQDEILKTASDMNRAADAASTPETTPGFFGRLKGNLGNTGLGMLAGAAAQFVPDLIAKNRMKNIQGPVAAPQMRYAAGLTDIDTGRAIAAVRNQTAQANAAVDQNFANPQVAAAMKRANMNAAQANLGNILSQEASQEMQLRNQELQRGTDVSNQNRMISAQNVQAQRDFENQRLAALNRMDMQMGQKLGGLYTDFQNRAQDRAKWEMYSKIFNEDMLKRQGIDPTA